MLSRVFAMALIGLLGTGASGADPERQLRVISSRSVPTIDSISVSQLVDGKRETVGQLNTFDRPLSLPGEGPFRIVAKPKEGIAIIVADNVMVKSRVTFELKLVDTIATLEVIGDRFPRAAKIVLTEERDPGPGAKGHVAIQEASDYRKEIAAPPGFYAVWIVPANGASPQRIEDRVRLMAGKLVRVGSD